MRLTGDAREVCDRYFSNTSSHARPMHDALMDGTATAWQIEHMLAILRRDLNDPLGYYSRTIPRRMARALRCSLRDMLAETTHCDGF
jgi:hypothetical protein